MFDRINANLGLSSAEFGLGAGLFFAGYLLAELPSNLMMLRFGSRLWLGRIMACANSLRIYISSTGASYPARHARSSRPIATAKNGRRSKGVIKRV